MFREGDFVLNRYSHKYIHVIPIKFKREKYIKLFGFSIYICIYTYVLISENRPSRTAAIQ